jgi:peptidyl-prolyl cis-trans isomerase C
MRITILLLGAAIAWGQEAPAADPVVLTVGSEKITKTQFEQIIASLPEQQKAQVATPAGRKALAEQLAELKALAMEARQRKLDQNPGVQTRIALQVDQVLATLLFQDLRDSVKPDEAALRAYYNDHKLEYEQVKARHILIRMQGSRVPLKANEKDLTDAEALAKTKELRAKIEGGADFAAVAKEESDDTGSGANGGDLGAFGKGQMVPEFEKAAFAMKVGDISEPVKSQFGYHLIQVQDHTSKTFEAVRPEIESKIKPDLAQKTADEVKNKTTIVYDKTYFGN